jgi:succinoglycan biosynthesis transport protein ExoP
MVPGRRYNARFLVRTLRRSWWMLVIPLAITGTIAAVLARALPDVYYAQGVVQVVPPRLPDNYVKGTMTLSLPERVVAARAQVLNPQQLQNLITEFDVYPSVRHRVPADVVMSWFRSSIKINVVQGDLFTVGYAGYSRTRVDRVAERLTTLMVQETLKQRETLSENRGQFLDTELEAARQRLEEHERKVSDYRRRYAGQLPTQVDTNMRMMQAASAELQTTEEGLSRDRARRDDLARELEAAEVVETAPSGDPAEIADPPAGNVTATLPAGPPAKQLQAARVLRARLQRRFTAEHPDMQTLNRHIAELEAAVAAAPAGEGPAATDPSHAAKLRASLKTLDAQIAGREATSKRLSGVIAGLRARVDAVPEREAEWMRLTRDYTTLQGVYANLLAKREESRLAASLDKQAVGEQVRVVDRPRRPTSPVSPNRRAVVLIGVGLGLGFGIAMLLIRELRDRTIRAEEEVIAALNLPVVGLVPRIVTAIDRRHLRRRRLLWSFAAAVLCVGLAALQWSR